MPPTIEWRLSIEAVRLYEAKLVFHILGPFARALVTWAAIHPGQWVLDVGCGTGAAARAAAEKVGRYGRVVGVDPSPAMLEIARTVAQTGKAIEWQEGEATRIPLPSRIFDVVLYAHTLQFLPDPLSALAEAQRVLRPGGWVMFSAWCSPDDSPYLGALRAALLHRLGAAPSAYFQAAFSLAEQPHIEQLMQAARFRNLMITVNRIDVRLPDLNEFVPQHIRATPAGEAFEAAGAETQSAIVADVRRALAEPMAQAGDWLAFQSYFVQARKLD